MGEEDIVANLRWNDNISGMAVSYNRCEHVVLNDNPSSDHHPGIL